MILSLQNLSALTEMIKMNVGVRFVDDKSHK